MMAGTKNEEKSAPKREKLPARRRWVARRIAVFLLLLLAVNHVLHLGYLLPVQGIRDIEERQGAPHGETLARLWTPEVHATHLVYLRGSEKAVTIADTYLTVYGWMGGFGWTLDCTEDAPLYAGEMTMRQDDQTETVCCYYGRVDDPDITRVEISVRRAYYVDGPEQWEETANLPVEGEDFIVRDEGRYFLAEDVIDDRSHESYHRAWIIAYDEDGNVVAEFQIQEGTHSIYF